MARKDYKYTFVAKFVEISSGSSTRRITHIDHAILRSFLSWITRTINYYDTKGNREYKNKKGGS